MTTSSTPQGHGANGPAEGSSEGLTPSAHPMPGDRVTLVVDGVPMGSVVVTRVYEPVKVLGGQEWTFEFKQIGDLFGGTATPLDVLELSARPSNALRAAGITTVEQLVQRSRAELLGLRSFGVTSLGEVQRSLEARGMMLHGLAGPAAVVRPDRPDSPDERWRALDAEMRMRLILAAAMESQWATANQMARRLGLSSGSKIASTLIYAVPRGEIVMRYTDPREYGVTEKGIRLAASGADVDAWDLFRRVPQNR